MQATRFPGFRGHSPVTRHIDPADRPIYVTLQGDREVIEQFGLFLIEAVSGELRILHLPDDRAELIFQSDTTYRSGLYQRAHSWGFTTRTLPVSLADKLYQKSLKAPRRGIPIASPSKPPWEAGEPFLISQIALFAPPIPVLPLSHPRLRETGDDWFVLADTPDADVYHALPTARAFYPTANAGLTYLPVKLYAGSTKQSAYQLITYLKAHGIPASRAIGLPHEQQTATISKEARELAACKN